MGGWRDARRNGSASGAMGGRINGNRPGAPQLGPVVLVMQNLPARSLPQDVIATMIATGFAEEFDFISCP
jgi:hypothetical protein